MQECDALLVGEDGDDGEPHWQLLNWASAVLGALVVGLSGLVPLLIVPHSG